jgi:hypothetical protein
MRSNFKPGQQGAAKAAAAKFPHDGQRVIQDESMKTTADPMERVPDMPIPAPPEKTGLTPSFHATMPYPEAPAARKPFKVK